MDIIRNKLKELGFVSEEAGSGYFKDLVFKYQKSVDRDATYYVWITSSSNWHFKIERAKEGHETGIEGYGRYTAFEGHISSLMDLDILLRCTYVYQDLKNGKNDLVSS